MGSAVHLHISYAEILQAVDRWEPAFLLESHPEWAKVARPLDGYQVYIGDQINQLVELYLNGTERERLDPILDQCVAAYLADLDEDGQVDFKSKAKGFVRTYNFLASVLPYNNASWEKLSIFLNFLVPKLPAPQEQDLTRGILETIVMESYRAEKRATMKIILEDANAEIEPVPTAAGGMRPEPEVDRLSNIIRTFNDLYGTDWSEADRIQMEYVIAHYLPDKVALDQAFQNAKKNSDRQNTRIEHDKAIMRAAISLIQTHTEFFKLYMDNEPFKKMVNDTVFNMVYK